MEQSAFGVEHISKGVEPGGIRGLRAAAALGRTHAGSVKSGKHLGEDVKGAKKTMSTDAKEAFKTDKGKRAAYHVGMNSGRYTAGAAGAAGVGGGFAAGKKKN